MAGKNKADREAFAKMGRQAKLNMRQGLNVKAQKGMGPNKASGHKGGISRQGSKRG